jgi:HD-GYP domain-containing protein (c-di-GMP phosphodiesterase class II)
MFRHLKLFAILCCLLLSGLMASLAVAQKKTPAGAQVKTPVVAQETTRAVVQPKISPVVALPKISIMEFNTFGTLLNPSGQLADLLMQKLADSKAYVPVERRQLDKVVKEQKLEISALTESQGADTLGRILGIDKMIVGNISQWERENLVTARLIDVKTGSVVARATYEGKTLEYGAIADTLARQLLKSPEVPNAQEEIAKRIYRHLFTLGPDDMAALKKGYGDNVLDALYDFWLETDRIQDTEIQESIILGKKIAKELGLQDSSFKLIELTLKLRRLGLLSLPKDILQQQAKLSDTVYTVLRYFPVATYTMLDQTAVRTASGLSPGMYRKLLRLVMYQRKNLDRSGYPAEIIIAKYPLESEIINICLVWSALTHDRNWRKAMDQKTALGIIKEDKGKQWTTNVYTAFMKHYKKDGKK